MFIFSKIKQIILLLSDILLLFVSLYFTLIIRYSQTLSSLNWQEHFYPFAIIYFIWVAIFYSQNLYNLNLTKNNLHFFKTLLESFVINIFIASFFFYFTPFFGITPKTNLFLSTGIAIVLIFLWRASFNAMLSKQSLKTRIAFLGDSKEVRELIAAFKNEPQLGYKCVGIISDENMPNAEMHIIKFTELEELAKKAKLNVIAMHRGALEKSQVGNELYKLIFSNISFINLPKFYEEITSKVPLGLISEGWFLENLQESEKKLYNQFKVVLDYFLGLFIFASFLLLLPFVAIGTLISSGRPIFYTQQRVGKGGKIFKIFKFRTMKRDAENSGARFASINDNRVTKFGRFLRKTRIDELPQALNILKGNLGVIGPRPERPEFVAELYEKASFYPIRHLVKPGLTGWAQINYPYAGTIEENIKKLQYDIFYIKNRSFLLDLAITLKTINLLLRLKGR